MTFVDEMSIIPGSSLSSLSSVSIMIKVDMVLIGQRNLELDVPDRSTG